MTGKYADLLSELGFEFPHWAIQPTEDLVRIFERTFALTLPPDYREFLLQCGGLCGAAVCRFQEPTPVGEDALVEEFLGFGPPHRSDTLAKENQGLELAPDFVAIAANGGGQTFLLRCTGRDAGSVYYFDGDGRSAWPDERFHEWFPNLDDSIRRYLDLRRAGQLPAKLAGYADLYRVAAGFAEFLAALRRPAEAAPEAPAPSKDPDWLAKAIARRDDAALQELIAGGRLNEPLHYGRTPMQIAAACNVEAVQWLHAAGADARGALVDAANNGRADIVRCLVSRGCDIEERRDGMTVLMWAVRFHFNSAETLDTIRALIELGANVNALSDAGESVLRLAGGQRSGWFGGTKGPPRVIRLLEAAGAKLDPK